MPKFRKHSQSYTIEANQWHKNGDHPHDNCKTTESGAYWEGAVVRYFRHPDPEKAGNKYCENKDCDDTLHHHGWIDSGGAGHVVCPGDWIIPDSFDGYYPIHNKMFNKLYTPVDDTLEEFGSKQLELPVEEIKASGSRQIDLPLEKDINTFGVIYGK